MKLWMVAVLLVIGCDDEAEQRAARRAEHAKVMREAEKTIEEGKALVAAQDKAFAEFGELENNGVIAVAILFASCDIASADEDVIANQARLKPFLPRLGKRDQKSTKCTTEDRELANEILAAVKR